MCNPLCFIDQLDLGTRIGYVKTHSLFYNCSHKYQLVEVSAPSDPTFLTLTLLMWALLW